MIAGSMRKVALALVAALAIGARFADGRELDYGKISCGQFLASGHDNVAALISWLRGYHAGKSGITGFQSPDQYGGRLGFYCRQHPDTNLVEASEQILAEIDRGL